ncbi:MAG: hypothetical protein FWE76_08570, partial [Symbiobacteriaceae bacterium]|nr:hypothetical protein [Symbiobacteriaceae bacterium]
MKSKPVALLGIISLLCTLFAFPIVIQAAPNVLQVTFYQDGDLQLRPNNNFILGSYSSAIDFIAVINHNEVPNDVKMTVTGPSSYSKTFDRIALSNGRYGFSGTLPNVTGLYKVSYFSASQTIAYAATTPLELGIHYRADASLNKSSLRIGDSNIRLNCTIRDRNGSVVTVRPRIELRGATFDNLNFSGNGTFTLDIGQITAAGTDALKLLFDDVVVYTWDVNASPFPALTIDPGILFVDKPQQIIISALGHDLYHTGLSEINNALLRVELEGVPIAKSSITRVPIDYESTGIVYGEETYRRVVLLASDLEVDAIRFTGGGTLRLKISDLDNRYESIVELPVQYAANAEGIFGGPIYQNYASESSFSYEFNLPNGKQVKEYSMIAFITDQE